MIGQAPQRIALLSECSLLAPVVAPAILENEAQIIPKFIWLLIHSIKIKLTQLLIIKPIHDHYEINRLLHYSKVVHEILTKENL